MSNFNAISGLMVANLNFGPGHSLETKHTFNMDQLMVGTRWFRSLTRDENTINFQNQIVVECSMLSCSQSIKTVKITVWTKMKFNKLPNKINC